ncbi:MAG: hypothetical protein GX443_06075 [Deltaproteobacteria bacterium]|nr:hypothetical protein [Deltaproteobacteria bacterium]
MEWIQEMLVFWFIVGLVSGVVMGILVVALCAMASDRHRPRPNHVPITGVPESPGSAQDDDEDGNRKGFYH